MEKEHEHKLAFARALLRFKDPYKAACSIFTRPSDGGLCIHASTNWPNDVVVVAECDRLIIEFGNEHFLPGKADMAKDLWAIATDMMLDYETRLRYYSLYAKLRGFIEKPPDPEKAPNGATIINKIMIVPGLSQDWEADTRRQQRELIDAARKDA